MARNISAASLAQLGTTHGTIPLNIVEIVWVAGGQRDAYADREIVEGSTIIKGRILQISGLQEVIQVSEGASTTEVEIILDDTDGSIKGILDNNDIHKRPCYIYQWFDGLALSEKFLVFQGEISSPLLWKESDRTVRFNVISKLEDKEIGFSPEEGEFTFIPKNLIGKPWPMCFGTCLDVPGVQIQETKVGTLAEGTGIHDFTIEYQVGALQNQVIAITSIAIYWALVAGFLKFIGNEEGGQQALDKANALFAQAGQIRDQIEELLTSLDEQKAQEISPVRIIGGRSFPQNLNMAININDAIFVGHFEGDFFHIDRRIHPEHANFFGDTVVHSGSGDFTLTQTDAKILPHNTQNITGGIGEIIEGDSAGFFWAEAGSKVSIAGFEFVDFVISIVPGTVLRVAAKQTFEGIKRLIVVPADRYTVKVVNYGSIQAVVVTMLKPLSTYTGEGWEDQIYVTFQSSVGPNTVDIISYLLNLYAPHLAHDAASFASVRARIDNYPSNFAFFSRLNIVDALQSIARQARCALWIANDTVYLRYLPEEPTSVTTITEDDVDTIEDQGSTMEVFHTDTEDLVTKYIGTWQESYAQDEPNKVILRHNVKKYGIVPDGEGLTEDFFIYNNQDLVIKSMTFWLIRMANTWKKMRFRTALNKLQVEAMDAVTLQFSQQYIANVAVKAIVEKAEYDSENQTINFEVWTPVKAGTMVPYDFAWPADIEQTLLFPTIEEEAAGFAGGDGPGKNAQGTVAAGTGLTGTVTYDDYCEGNRDSIGVCRRDYGDRYPSDQGDVKPNPPYAPIDTGPQKGNPNLKTPKYQQNPITDGPAIQTIDIRTTSVYDSQTHESTTFSTFFKQIRGAKLQMDTTAQISNGENEGEFDFKWNEDKFAAGRAFLKD